MEQVFLVFPSIIRFATKAKKNNTNIKCHVKKYKPHPQPHYGLGSTAIVKARQFFLECPV